MHIWQQQRYNPGRHAGRAEDEARNDQDRRDADTDMRNRRRGYYGPGPFDGDRTGQIRQDDQRDWRGAAYRR
jgi:hypothetical protein